MFLESRVSGGVLSAADARITQPITRNSHCEFPSCFLWVSCQGAVSIPRGAAARDVAARPVQRVAVVRLEAGDHRIHPEDVLAGDLRRGCDEGVAARHAGTQVVVPSERHDQVVVPSERIRFVT